MEADKGASCLYLVPFAILLQRNMKMHVGKDRVINGGQDIDQSGISNLAICAFCTESQNDAIKSIPEIFVSSPILHNVKRPITFISLHLRMMRAISSTMTLHI